MTKVAWHIILAPIMSLGLFYTKTWHQDLRLLLLGVPLHERSIDLIFYQLSQLS